MYGGSVEPRFVLLPHDLDTIFGEGDTNSSPSSSIFPMLTANIPRQNEDGRIPQLVAFFQQPSIRKKYFTELKELLNNEFSKAKFDARMQNFLADWSTPADRSSIISYMDARRSFILGEIDPILSASSSLPVVSGLPRTTQPALSLNGGYNLTNTSAVIVAGNNATLNPIAGTWSISDIDLLPGVNRVTVEALDPDGNRVSSRQIDIWHDDGDTEPTTATLMGTVTRTADPQSGGIGHIYIAVFTDDPVWATDSADVAGLTLLADVDFSSGDAEVAYEITDIEPRNGEYYLVAFLDDNGTATDADPSPDQGDLFTFETAGVPTVDLPEPGEYEVDLVLNAVMPF